MNPNPAQCDGDGKERDHQRDVAENRNPEPAPRQAEDQRHETETGQDWRMKREA